MSISRRVFQALPLGVALLSAALLAGCGGGAATADMHNQQAGSGPVNVDPAPTPSTPGGQGMVAFADMANKAICTEWKNRLYVIDGKQVFWDRAGNCPDMSYEHVLFGATPQEKLCSQADSFAGPMTSCRDESARPLFETIVQNLDKDDLGLGFSHTVERVSLLVPNGTAVPFKVLDGGNRSGIHDARNLVIKDASTFATVWAQHAGAGQAVPAVDFSTSMVLAVFLGDRPSGCYVTSISSVTRGAAGIAVQHTDTVPGMGVMCTMAITSPSALVVIDRSDLPVEFTTKVVPNR